MIVPDASAVLEVLLGTTASPEIQERLFAGGESLHAPHLLDLEVTQVLRRYVLGGDLTPQRGKQALADLTDFPILRYPHDLFLSRIWALRHNATAYDAAVLGSRGVTRCPVDHLRRARGRHVRPSGDRRACPDRSHVN